MRIAKFLEFYLSGRIWFVDPWVESFELFELEKSSEDEKKRESVVAVWRHGRRSPMVFLPKLNDSLDMWPDGTRQLTARGIEGLFSSLGHQGQPIFRS